MPDRIRHVLVALVLTFFGAHAAFAQSAPQTLTVALGGKGLFYLIHYVAEGAGLYQQEGLKADDVNVQSGPVSSAAVIGGSADLTLTGFEQVVHSVSEGGSLVAISNMFTVFPFSVVVSTNAIRAAGLTRDMSLKDRLTRLHGLSIGISAPGSAGDTFMRTMYQARGMNADSEIRLQPVGGGTTMSAAFEKGIINGFVWGPPLPEIAAAQGTGQVMISALDGDVPEYNGIAYLVAVTSRATLANKRPLLLSAVRALTRAITFVHEQPDAARGMVRAAFPEINDSDFHAAFDHALKGVPTTPVVSPEQVKGAIATLNISEKKPLQVSYDSAVDTDLATAAADALLAK